ncbi:L,D-transpeptidase family protein [Sphingomonas oligophenolica]|nr:L,D-transpeptidase family protein [Sphingomonas oligophenolica]
MRRFISSGSVIMLMALLATPALAADAMPGTVAIGGGVIATKLATLRANTFVWDDQGVTQPVSIVISIPDQKAYVYRGETMVAASSVSTGKDGKDTPVGTFPILQKEEMHHSNLYDSAPMPFMQRLTWDGVAIHAGRNPGFPASHGCVRVPRAFAEKLFTVTTLGTPVMVTQASASEGFVPPRPYDAAKMAAATADANAAQFDAVMNTMNR